MDKIVETIEIDKTKKYVIKIKNKDKIDADEINSFKDCLERWWRSDESFIVLSLFPGLDVEIKEVKGDN